MWFVYSSISSNIYFQYKHLQKSKQHLEANNKLLSIYITGIKVFSNRKRSYAAMIANNYGKLDSVNLAKLYFEKAINDMPYWSQNYFDYASYEFRNGDYQSSLDLAELAFKYNKDFIFLQNLLVKSSINMGDTTKAKFYLSRLSNSLENTHVKSYKSILNNRIEDLHKMKNGLPYTKTTL